MVERSLSAKATIGAVKDSNKLETLDLARGNLTETLR